MDLWFLPLLLSCLLFHLPLHHALSFKFPNFTDSRLILTNGTAAIENGILSLTSNRNDNKAAGRAVYLDQLHLYDPITGNSTDFTTQFSFKISTVDPPGQDGLAFFLSPNGSLLPDNASGGCLALFSKCHDLTTRKELVAVEFDTFGNTNDTAWDITDKQHVGININSIKSAIKQDLTRSMNNGTTVDAIVRYDSKASDLSVSWSFAGDPFVSLSHRINLTTVLPEWVSIGFAAGSAYYFETHDILSWEFTTELSPAGNISVGLIVGCVIGGLFLACGIILVLVLVWRKRNRGKEKEGFMEQEIELRRFGGVLM